MIPANSVIMTSRATIGECAINRIPVSTKCRNCLQGGFGWYEPHSALHQPCAKGICGRASRGTCTEAVAGEETGKVRAFKNIQLFNNKGIN
jgi:hypothetical protein